MMVTSCLPHPLPTPLATVDNNIPGLGCVEYLAASPGHAGGIINAIRDDIPSKISDILGRGTHPGEILFVGARMFSIGTSKDK